MGKEDFASRPSVSLKLDEHGLHLMEVMPIFFPNLEFVLGR